MPLLYPLHVSSIIPLIFRRTTALVQYLLSSLSLGDFSTQVTSGLRSLVTCLTCVTCVLNSHPKDSDDNRCCTNTIYPSEDEHNSARNMYSNVIKYYNKEFVHQVGKKMTII